MELFNAQMQDTLISEQTEILIEKHMVRLSGDHSLGTNIFAN